MYRNPSAFCNFLARERNALFRLLREVDPMGSDYLPPPFREGEGNSFPNRSAGIEIGSGRVAMGFRRKGRASVSFLPSETLGEDRLSCGEITKEGGLMGGVWDRSIRPNPSAFPP